MIASAHQTLRKALTEANRRWLDTGEICEISGVFDGEQVTISVEQMGRLWAKIGLPIRRSNN